MALYQAGKRTVNSVKKRTSVGDGLRKRGSFKKRNQKQYRGQGK